ncbi:hypothetical protein DFQ26_003055 [Actinomortierella ambigua]|nr:hypothetical protein DFQ26_003055 [Actinomortierella ambigua]
MFHRLSVCTAFRPPAGYFKLSIENLGLDVEGHRPGSPAILGLKDRSLVWELDPHGRIIDTKSRLFLGYERVEVNAPLILTLEPVEWTFKPSGRGFKIYVPHSDLVFATLPSPMYPPKIGLTYGYEEIPQAWELEPAQELDSTPYVPEGYFELMLANGRYLGVLDQEPSSPVFLLDHPSHSTIWELRSEGPPDLVSIRNRETGLYLTYNPRNLEDRLLITPHISVFRLLTIEPGVVQIVTGLIGMPPRAVAEMRPTRPGPPMAGLTEIRKDPSQIWSLRPILRLDDPPRQYRLPFRRLRFW